MKNILKTVFVIIGTLIGAGFASGQEIYTFFFSHGIKGIFGMFISSTLIGIIIYKCLEVINKNEIKTYKDFLDNILQKNKNEIIKKIINILINIFILATFFIMVAGFGAFFEQQIGINSLIGSTILAILCFIILLGNIKRVVKANEILVPILISVLIIIGIINIKEINLLEIGNYLIETNKTNYILNAILYTSYNSILLIPVLITLKNYLKDKKQIIKISFITSIIVMIVSSIIFLLLTKIDVDITKLEMPIVYVVSHMQKIIKYSYSFIILVSIFTTAISLGNSFLQNISKNKKSYTQFTGIMCITSVLISKIGFSNLVNNLYPIFGYIGLIQIIKIIFK